MKFKLVDGRLQRQLPVSQSLSLAPTPQSVEPTVPASQLTEQVDPEILASRAIEQVLIIEDLVPQESIQLEQPQVQVSAEQSSPVAEHTKVKHESIFHSS